MQDSLSITAAEDQALIAVGVSYIYDTFEALHDVSLTISPGELVVLVGRNGAGKSTLLRCLAGWSQPSDGEITVCGLALPDDEREVRRRLVLVPDVPRFYAELTAWEHLQLVGRLNRSPDYPQQAERLLRRFGLWQSRHAFPSGLSRGMRYKLALCTALLVRPRLLLLDEPFGPLDPVSALFLWEDLLRMRTEGLGILISSHQLPAGAVPDRYVILEQGEVLACDSPAALRTTYRLDDAGGVDDILRAAVTAWEAKQGG